MTNVQELIKDPCWLPEGFDAGRAAIRFARIDRAGLVREAFLDRRMSGSVTARAEAPLEAILAALDGAPQAQAPSFIFHTAFCCSTLLARALDAPGRALALKEPNILLDLANAARVDERMKREPAQFERAARAVFALLARPHLAGERVVVKPTNVAATLAPLALKAGAPCLFLYGDLREYLVSLLKKGEEGRSFVRQQFNIYALDGAGLAAFGARQATSFTDLQVATLVWRHQLEQSQRLLADATHKRLASLDFRALLARPAATLQAVARHLGLDIPASTLEATAAGETFLRDAKFSDRPFDAAARLRQEGALAERWRDELDLMARWSEKLNLGVEMTLPLPKALAI